jgi:3-oxoacyl-[acyl-carrier-protein] synthase II
VTPHAGTLPASWAALRDGVRAVRTLLRDGPSAVPREQLAGRETWIGAPLDPDEIDPEWRALLEQDLWLAGTCQAAREATRSAGLTPASIDPERVATVIGSSKGGLAAFARGFAKRSRSPDLFPFWETVPPSAAATLIAADGWRGPCLAPVAACATGLVSMATAANLIRQGDCDAAIAGSGDASLLPSVLASFRRLGVLAPAANDPSSACRPFAANRRGFAIGEGAGVLVLERWDHAVARGVPILAEWRDGLFRSDPTGLTVLADEPRDLVRLIHDLLTRCDLAPRDIDAVSLHGTGTRMNDRYEARAVREAIGSALDEARAFALKGGIGHLLGAAGSVETVAAVCALRSQIVPASPNCRPLDPECELPLTEETSQPRRIRHLLKLSLGFGGHLTAAVLSAADSPATVPSPGSN